MQALKGRGKRSKARKAKDKYAEQDEEDRALALQLLGSAGNIRNPIFWKLYYIIYMYILYYIQKVHTLLLTQQSSSLQVLLPLVTLPTTAPLGA